MSYEDWKEYEKRLEELQKEGSETITNIFARQKGKKIAEEILKQLN